MPLDTIYLTRHGLRLNWTIDLSTGTYYAYYPTPTGIPVDPTLTGPGIRQSHELAAHVSGAQFRPKPCRVYSSPFYRCLQTIQPTVEALKRLQDREKKGNVDLKVRVENGLGEWFGYSSFFKHPSPASTEVLDDLFPSLLSTTYTPQIFPSPSGESIAQLHDRVATTLETIIADVDDEIRQYGRAHPEAANESYALIICAHAAPLIAMGRALTGLMPEDSSAEDFNVFTAGLSTFKRRSQVVGRLPFLEDAVSETDNAKISGKRIPSWRGGQGVGGGWDCVVNGECSFLSNGAERGWHFHGEEDFNSMSTTPTVVADSGSREDTSGSTSKL